MAPLDTPPADRNSVVNDSTVATDNSHPTHRDNSYRMVDLQICSHSLPWGLGFGPGWSSWDPWSTIELNDRGRVPGLALVY